MIDNETSGDPSGETAQALVAAKPRGPRISLVLGSGGARGYAHIGVIEELEAQGYNIASIAGSSMGALVGGVYAAGKLDAYSEWVRPLHRLGVLRLLDWTLSGGGFIKGDRIIDAMRDLIGEIDIEKLPISYTAVAVDLDAQREVWFSRGPLFDAIRASIAIPTIIRPHRYEGRLFVDGGLLNPLPVSATLRDLTDFTIAVDVNSAREPLDPQAAPGAIAASDDAIGGQASPQHLSASERSAADDQRGTLRRLRAFLRSWLKKNPDGNVDDAASAGASDPGLVELFARSLDIVQETITRLKLAAQPPDLLITIPRNVCAFYEFDRAEEVIEVGRQRTREALARWQSPMPRRR